MTDPYEHTRIASMAAALPFAVSFVAIPLGVSALELLVPKSYLPLALVWAVLAGFGGLWLLWRHMRPAKEFPSLLRRVLRGFEALLVLGMAGAMLGGFHDWATIQIAFLDQPHVSEALRWLKQASPLLFGLFALLWCWTFGLPTRQGIYRLGLLLTLIVIGDTALGLYQQGLHLPETGHLLLMHRESLACLLAVALYAGMDDDTPNQPGWRAMRFTDALLMLGLCLTLSRTALFASACVWIFLGRGSAWLRLPCALVMLAVAALSLLSTLPIMADTVSLTGHLLWIAGVEHFMEHPETLLRIQGLGPFTLSLPTGIAVQLGLPARTELLMPEEIESLWMRLALVWGAYGPGLILLAMTLPAILRPTRLASGLVALLITQGTVFGLLHRADVGVALWLALLAAFGSWQPTTESEEDAEDPWFAIEEEH